MKTSTRALVWLATITAVAAAEIARAALTVDAREPAAVASAASPMPLLTEEQLRNILKYVEKPNKHAALDREVTDLLGLTKNRDVLMVLSRSIKDDRGIVHSFYRLDADAGCLVAKRTANVVMVFRLDRNRSLVAALVNPADSSAAPYLVPSTSVVHTLQEELQWWENKANGEL